MKVIFLLLVAVVVAFVAAYPDIEDKIDHISPSPAQPASKAESEGEATEVPAAPPLPFYHCDAKVENPKYYNESCKNDIECFGDGSMVCKNGICTCSDTFVVEERFLGEAAAQKICVAAPHLFAPCQTICQKPYVCKTYEGSTSKACQCVAPYKLVDSFCFLDCKEGEYYDQTLKKCITKCKANEVKINSTCKPQADVGSACEINLQCVAEYSECKDKKCVCRNGFSAKDGACVSDTANCPNGDALKSDAGGYKRCFLSTTVVDDKKPPSSESSTDASSSKAALPFIPSRDLKDNCPDSHFCLITGGESYVLNAVGICCPKMKVTCPFGNPSTKHSCNPGPKEERCPYETHFCYGLSIDTSSYKQVCCPKQCPSNTVSVKGKCLPRAGLNEACAATEQCTDTSAGCIDGFCKCANGSKESGGAVYKYCSHECKDGETLYNKKCYSRLSLGDSCEGQDWRCPTNAHCNNKKVCACQCGQFTLSKDICAPAPSCPRPIMHTFGRGMEGPAAPPPPPPPPPPLIQITEEKKKELLENVTFCTVKSKKVPSDVKTGDCSKTQYCATYIQNLGICCTKPEPKCPDGSKPVSDKPCDIKNPLSCGPDNKCHQYLSPADRDSADGRICCKSFQSNPLPPHKRR